MNTPFHVRLKKLRTDHKMSQARLAIHLDTTRDMVTKLETGRRPPRQRLLYKLSKLFGISISDLGAVPVRIRTRHKKVYQLLGATLPEIRRPSGPRAWVRILHARRVYGDFARGLLDSIRARRDRKRINQFLQIAGCGSREEAMVLLHSFALEAKADAISVMRVGSRDLPVIDDSQKIIGDRPLPALFFERPTPLVLFPQVTLQLRDCPPGYPYRSATLDFLAVTRVHSFTVFINVDVNGGGHDGREDRRRTELIGLPRLVVTPDDLKRSDFIPWFHNELELLTRRTLLLAA